MSRMERSPSFPNRIRPIRVTVDRPPLEALAEHELEGQDQVVASLLGIPLGQLEVEEVPEPDRLGGALVGRHWPPVVTSAPPKAAIKAVSAAKAAAGARILPRPGALRPQMLAAFISSIASAPCDLRTPASSLGRARLETDNAASARRRQAAQARFIRGFAGARQRLGRILALACGFSGPPRA